MSRLTLAIVVFVQFSALLAVCLLIGDNGWDDGAITLAFSRTFAKAGIVALTTHSETVEGFSSVSWFLLHGVIALARPSYHGSILVSQLVSALCICSCTVVLARTCALLQLDKLFSTLAVVAFAAWGCSFSEASNGMEMGLLAVSFLVIVNELLSQEPRILLLSMGVVLSVTTRFEAIAYVGLLALSVVRARSRRAFWALLISGAGAVVALSIWRLAVFSDVLPNTFWAKRWQPYAAFDFSGRMSGAMELPSFFLASLLALEVLLRLGFDIRAVLRARRQAFLILGLPILGTVLMGGLIGRNWGYEGRMPYFAFPLALLLLSLLLSPWLGAMQSKLRVAVVVGLYALSIGSSMSGFPSDSLRASLAGKTFRIAPRTYAETGRVFQRFTAAAAIGRPIILTPDVGGLALSRDEFRIVDLALLSNRTLAHRGHAALAEVLEAESPDIVEAHWDWATLGRLYDLPYFRTHYVPAFAEGTKLWIRSDRAKAIEGKARGCWVSVDRSDLQEALSTHRYAEDDSVEDKRAFRRTGFVFALNAPDGTSENWCR